MLFFESYHVHDDFGRCGPDSGDHYKEARIQEIHESIAEGMSSLENGESRPVDEVFDELREEFGFPVPEKDAQFEELKHSALTAILDCEVYVRTRERKRILAAAREDKP